MFSSPISAANRSPRIPSPPPSLPTLFPAISSLSPLAPLMNSTNNNAIFDLSQNNYSLNNNNNNNNRTTPLPAPVFLDLQTEINRSVMTMPSLSSLNDFGGYTNKYEPVSNQKINTKTDLFAGSPLLQESLVDAPAVPSYFDRMSSFYSSSSSCGEILSSLSALFYQNNIDHKIKDHKKQIKGLAYVNEHPVHFRVYIYYESLSKYLIEFQKRDGCCFAFRQLYKSLIGQMSHQLCQEQCVNDNNNNNNNTASYSGSLSLAPLSLKESRAETFNQCSALKFGTMPLSFLDHDSVNILLTMAQADCIQSQREALRALSSSSAHDGEQACMALLNHHQSEQLIKFFSAINTIIVNVSEQDEELIRCALTFFNNLLEQKTKEASSIRSTLFSGTHLDTQRFINKILSLLDDPIHLSDELTMAEIKRQCARFISTLSQFNGSDMKPLLDGGAWSIINRYENCDDSRLRSHINAAKVALAK